MAIAKVIFKSGANDSGTVWIDTTQKTVTSGTMLSGQTALKNDGTDITGNIATKTSADLSASGATVTVPAGYYASQASKSVASGTAGTPTATKGTVSNHSVAVTPKVTNSAGYISGGTKTGTAVTVSASELVSGNKEITSNGTNIDVVGYATVSVNVSGGGSSPLTLLAEDEVVVTSASSSEETVKTISFTRITSTNFWVVGVVSDEAGARDGYFLTSIATARTGTASGRTAYIDSDGFDTSTSGLYGVYMATAGFNNVTIKKKSGAGTVNGTYSVKIYLVDLSAT